MKAIARLCWTYGTALPIQRWLGWLMVGIWALVLLTPLPSPLGLLTTVMYVLATTFVAGFLFRSLSAPRTHRFLPRFRVRMLAAFLIVIAAVSMSGLAIFVLPAPSGEATSAGLGLLVVLNLFALLTFSVRMGLMSLLLLPPCLAIFAGRFRGATDILVASPTITVIAIWVGGWTAFAVWYLRAREIRRPQLQWPPAALGRGFDARLATDTVEFSRSSAFATYFNARYPPRMRDLLAWVFPLAAAAALSMLLRRFVPANTFTYVMVGLMLPVCMLAPLANQLARRTRLLWLATGMSRRALFVAAERAIWGNKVPRTFAAFAGIVGAVALAYDLPVGLLARLFAVWAGGTALAVYFGFVMRGALTVELCAALALIPSLSVGAWAALGEPPRYDWLLGVVALQLAGAGALRALAIARWERLDWLTFRPVRAFSQSIRARR